MKKDNKEHIGPGYLLDAGLDPPAVHIIGGRTLLIEGCKGIAQISGERIALDMGSRLVTIYGNGIEISQLSRSQMTLRCELSSLTFDKKGTGDGD